MNGIDEAGWSHYRSARTSWLGVGALASLVLLACGNAGSVGHGGAGGEATTASTGSAGGKAHRGHGVGVVSDLVSLPAVAHSWSVFVGYTPSTDSSSCHATTYGACVVNECNEAMGTGTGMPSGFVAAGNITVAAGPHIVTLTPNALNSYMFADEKESFVTGGQTITFNVDGAGDIPPHTGSVVAPHPVVMSTPDFGSKLVVNRGENFPLTWSNGGAEDSVIFSLITSSPGSDVTLSTQCTFDAELGESFVPSDVLSKLPAGSTGDIEMWVQGTPDAVEAGDWQVTFYAKGQAVQGSKPARTNAKFD